MIYIHAGNFAQAKTCAQILEKKDAKEWRFIADISDLGKMYNNIVVCWGTYHDREDINTMLLSMHKKGMINLFFMYDDRMVRS